jgi:hypothetical protein
MPHYNEITHAILLLELLPSIRPSGALRPGTEGHRG